jgi:choline dehydrogenase-like flavoprotein
MGNNPASSVTDSYGQVHDAPGLVIGGGALFPTAGGGSPTFTMLALAERACDHLLGRGRAPGNQL